MEFLKEFLEQENVELLKEFFKAKKQYKQATESEEIYKNELIARIKENNEFLYVNEDTKKVVI